MAALTELPRNFGDSFQSLLTGLGVWGRDRVHSMRAHLDFWEQLTFDKASLDALYRGNWLARKIVDIPAFDATRAWRTWDAEQKQTEALEATERQFGLQYKMLNALIKARLYGGAAIIIGCNDGPFERELNLEAVGKDSLKFVHVVEKWMLAAGPRVRDITSPWFGEPNYYMRSNIPIIEAPGGVQPLPSGALEVNSDALYIHPSRVVRLVGLNYPDIEMCPDAWGDSVLQPIYEALREAGLVSSSMANMVSDCKVDVYKIPGLTGMLSTNDGTQQFMKYLTNANVAKSVLNALVMDKDFEWDRVQTRFEGVPKVLETFLLICAAAGDIPSTRLLSREPSGQNSTGESDTRNYYDRLHADQTIRLTPALTRLDEVLIRTTFGKRPAEISYKWNSLWQLSDSEKATIALQKAQAFQIDNNSSLIPPEVLAIARENQLVEDGTYPGLATTLEEYDAEAQAEQLAEERQAAKQQAQGQVQGQVQGQAPLKNKTQGSGGNDDESGDGSDNQSDEPIGTQDAKHQRRRLRRQSDGLRHLRMHDEEPGHPFRGNQYATGESNPQQPTSQKSRSAQEQSSNGSGPDTNQLKNARIVHSKYEVYARAARLLAKERNKAQRAKVAGDINNKYARNADKAKSFSQEKITQRAIHKVATKFTKEKVGEFATKHTAGLAHQIAFRHLIMPAVEGAVVAGITEMGLGPETAAAAAGSIEVAHYAIHHLMEYTGLGPEGAEKLLHGSIKAIKNKWKDRSVGRVGEAEEGHVEHPMATMNPHSANLKRLEHIGWDSVMQDQDYSDTLDALDRLDDTFDQYGDILAKHANPEIEEDLERLRHRV